MAQGAVGEEDHGQLADGRDAHVLAPPGRRRSTAGSPTGSRPRRPERPRPSAPRARGVRRAPSRPAATAGRRSAALRSTKPFRHRHDARTVGQDADLARHPGRLLVPKPDARVRGSTWPSQATVFELHRRGRTTLAAAVRPEAAIAEAVVKTAGSVGRRTVMTTAAVRAVIASTRATTTGIQWDLPRTLGSASEEVSDIVIPSAQRCALIAVDQRLSGSSHPYYLCRVLPFTTHLETTKKTKSPATSKERYGVG